MEVKMTNHPKSLCIHKNKFFEDFFLFLLKEMSEAEAATSQKAITHIEVCV